MSGQAPISSSLVPKEGMENQSTPRRHRVPAWFFVVGAVFLMGAMAIALIAGTIVVSYFHGKQKRDIRHRVVLEMHAISTELSNYKAKHGEYPASLSSIAGAFHGSMPFDPYRNRPFIYTRTSKGFNLLCLGSDGVPGGVDFEERDIQFHEGGFETLP